MPLPRHQSQHLVWTREAPPQPQKAPPTASADFRAFGVVSLRLQARACGSDGVVSAMRVLIRPIDSMPTSLLQRRLSRSGLSTAAATVTRASHQHVELFSSKNPANNGTQLERL